MKVAEYVYDAWGNCTITLDKNSCGTGNPFRYRGYYFDNDLNMYYLITRYYDPQTGRFINADTPEYLDPKTINGLNLYSYCNNNPVMNVDPSGHEPISTNVALALMYGCFALIFIAMYFVDKYASQNQDQPSTGGNSGSGTGISFPSFPAINIPLVTMGHDTVSLFEKGSIGWLFGNLSYTLTTQEDDSSFIYNFIDYGDDQINSGIGISFGGWFGSSWYLSTNSSAGFSIQTTPWTTIGMEFGPVDGISFSLGLVNGNVSHEWAFTIGMGSLALLGVIALASVPIPGSKALATVLASLVLVGVTTQ
ncbi:MAG: RHS repeat-associated core domain-containing protein [Clostridia bacterium]|nr:RHS repeat-associated core domain-containing protein [Clostridia bacterium]